VVRPLFLGKHSIKGLNVSGSPERLFLRQILSLENIIHVDTLVWLNLLFCGAGKKYEEKQELDNIFTFASTKAPYLWFTFVSARILVGGLSYWTSLMIIVQADNNVDLFSDFAALQVCLSIFMGSRSVSTRPAEQSHGQSVRYHI